MPAHSRRLSILTTQEIEELYGLPQFSDEDRRLYFALSTAEKTIVDSIHTTSVSAYMILQLGYFKAKCQFFTCKQEAVLSDLQYIAQHYFPDYDLAALKPLSKPTRLEQQQIILKLFNYRFCDQLAKDALEQKTQRIAKLSIQPIYLLRETLRHLDHHRIVIPGYTFLQDLVGRTITGERKRITQLLNQAIRPSVKQQLDELLQAEEGIHLVSALKHEPKDFSYKELRQEVARRKFFQPLYDFAKTFLATAELSRESIKYYASLVHFYTVYKLKRTSISTTYLYLLCFAYHRFRQINDNLIEAFIHLVNHYEKQAKQAASEAAQQTTVEASEHLKAAGQVLNLFIDPSIPAETSFETVKTQAFSLLEPQYFPVVADYIRNVAFNKISFEWAYYTTMSLIFKRNLRHLFCDLEFAGRIENAPLLKAVVFLQTLLRQDKSPKQVSSSKFPIAIIPKSLQRYLFTLDESQKKILQVDRYEFLIYRLLRNALESGDVYVKDSNEFRRFEDDLITDVRWQDKTAILREIGAPILISPIQDTLATFRKDLETKFKSVNHRIETGENKHVKLKLGAKKRSWSLLYPSEEEPLNSSFYSQLPSIGIADLLWFVTGKTGFLSSFTHILHRYIKQEPDPQEILACIVAMGTNMGLWRMTEVSGLKYPSLLTTARNYLRLETLQAANTSISNAIAALPGFHYYNIQQQLHSSSDGQRIETQINTINARHSSKYFALKKGVSAYTLVANHVPINAKIIGAHEHESHYVFDLLHNNQTEIKPERHSTDTHGTNQVNFWILHAFGYRFAPRYRDLHKKTDTLLSFIHPNHYEDCLIKPSRKVYDELICKEWPNIQRIMASLAQKDVTQSTIVRKLSSYTRQNQTKKALWELDNICRTLYILDFIDDVTLRQNVQKALNRGEAYHRLRRAIAYVNSGKFRVKTETEQQVWNECSRLMANAIIFYNTDLLSRVHAQKQAVNDTPAMDIIQAVSPVAWQHINLFGTFEFNQTDSTVDLDTLAALYDNPDYWNKTLKETLEEE